MPEHAIVFERMTFSYPGAERAALDEVSVAVPEGSFVLAVGPTGAGKSTLLRAANGLVPHFSGGAFAGRAIVAGRSTLDHAPRALADVVAFVPQDPAASFVLDRVEDELAYGMENLGVEPARMRRRIEETLDLLDLDRLRGRSVRSLSGGERQRVAIAAALAAGPRILVLDEPTSALDPQGAEDVLAALQRLVDDHAMTVLIAEHRLERVAGFVDLALGCRDGQVFAGTPSEVFETLDTGPAVSRTGRALGWQPVPVTVREARGFARHTNLPAHPAKATRDRDRDGGALLAARDLSAGYSTVDVLEHIDLEFRAGEIVTLMGRNGAGKTTLLRCLAGVHEPSSGTVRLAGDASSSPRAGVDVALCPQDPESVLFRDTVAEEIRATVRALDRRGGRRRRPATRDVLELLGIEDLRDRHPRDLSAGQRLLVATAAIVATGAPVLLLDEPTRGLDAASKERLTAFLREYASVGHAVVVATHDVELAAAIANRVVMLAGGEVIADGSPEQVLGDSRVFAPQTARVFGPAWLTPEQIVAALVPAP